MSSDTLLSIANLLLPEALVKYFDMTKHEIKGEEIHFYFTELNEVPEEFKDFKLYSKGFFPEATVQDFSIRGKNVGSSQKVGDLLGDLFQTLINSSNR